MYNFVLPSWLFFCMTELDLFFLVRVGQFKGVPRLAYVF